MSASRTELEAIPSEEDLIAVGQLPLLDETGRKVAFGSLYEHQRTIVVFIRHFHCGLCQQEGLSSPFER